ncbi:hypothetical protein LSTR_LSTR002322 [Laodelphax striatellus]|uniref:Uncharacterized protein n=1 Tax=Laodelphax striatellus TaxID=195883 RepID=A0A482X251_LAOST|nr:hypothetical protein LSTR_LSTR002322 [Laodelphax striatellus]
MFNHLLRKTQISLCKRQTRARTEHSSKSEVATMRRAARKLEPRFAVRLWRKGMLINRQDPNRTGDHLSILGRTNEPRGKWQRKIAQT